MVLISAVAVKYQYEFIIVQLVAGLVAIYSLRELSKRSQIFLTALLVTIGSAAVYFALQLIQADDLSKLDQTMYYHFAVQWVLPSLYLSADVGHRGRPLDLYLLLRCLSFQTPIVSSCAD